MRSDDGSNNEMQGSDGALLAASLDGGDSLRGAFPGAEATSLVTRSVRFLTAPLYPGDRHAGLRTGSR